jgi:predicted RND superfamily exporter protein
MISGTAVAAGFAVLVLSDVPANAHLGALLVLSVVFCLAA